MKVANHEKKGPSGQRARRERTSYEKSIKSYKNRAE